jgi:hypothetical protein
VAEEGPKGHLKVDAIVASLSGVGRCTWIHNREPKTSPCATPHSRSHCPLLYLKVHIVSIPETMSQYEASVPEDGSLKSGIASFFEAFYAISDTAEAHEQYADHFTRDAKLIMASKETSGRQGI